MADTRLWSYGTDNFSLNQRSSIDLYTVTARQKEVDTADELDLATRMLTI